MLEIGKLIPEEYRNIFNKLISTKEMAVIAADNNLSTATLHNLVYGTTTISKDNYCMVDDLIKKSLSNIDTQTNYLEKTKPELEVLKTAYKSLNEKVQALSGAA